MLMLSHASESLAENDFVTEYVLMPTSEMSALFSCALQPRQLRRADSSRLRLDFPPVGDSIQPGSRRWEGGRRVGGELGYLGADARGLHRRPSYQVWVLPADEGAISSPEPHPSRPSRWAARLPVSWHRRSSLPHLSRRSAPSSAGMSPLVPARVTRALFSASLATHGSVAPSAWQLAMQVAGVKVHLRDFEPVSPRGGCWRAADAPGA